MSSWRFGWIAAYIDTAFFVKGLVISITVAASAGYANAILPFVQLIAANGALEACRRNRWLARGLTVANGVLTLDEAANVQNRPYTPIDDFLANGSDKQQVSSSKS